MAPPVLYRVIYGSTNPEPWQKSLTTVRPALLQGYRRHKVRLADYPGILPVPTQTAGGGVASVRGSLVTGLTEGDIWRLDIFEGSQYTRDKVRVKVLKDTALNAAVDEENLADHVEGELEAETYVWCDPREDLEEEEWDFGEFVREKMWAWVGEGADEGATDVDGGFADVDRAVEQKKNDPTGGRGMNGAITKELERAAV